MHQEKRTRMERYVWSNVVGVMLIGSLYSFILDVTLSTRNNTNVWFYSWYSVMVIIVSLLFGLITPSVFVAVFFLILMIGVSTTSFNFGWELSGCAYLYAFLPLLIAIGSIFLRIFTSDLTAYKRKERDPS